LHRICREEDAGDRVIVARVVIVQPRYEVVVLAGVAFAGVGAGRACGEARGSVGSVELRAEQRSAVDDIFKVLAQPWLLLCYGYIITL